MSHSKFGKIALVAFATYSATMPHQIPLQDYASIQIPLWIFPAILFVAWLLEGLKADALQIPRTNICLTPSGALIPLTTGLFLTCQLRYLTPFAIGVVMMAGLMFKLSKPDFLRGSIRFKLSYALALSYGIAALAALLMEGRPDVAFNIRFLAPLAGAVGTVGILIGNVATGLELSSKTTTPATFKQKIILGGNGVHDVLWSPLIVAVILFTIPEIMLKLQPLFT